jgi:hypothetical protein
LSLARKRARLLAAAGLPVSIAVARISPKITTRLDAVVAGMARETRALG